MRFFQEDGEQFGVDLCVAGLCQFQGFRRGFRCRSRRDRRQRLIQRLTGGECSQRGLGRITEAAIRHQVGILLHRLEVVFEFGLQVLIFRRCPQGISQGTSFPGLLGQLGLHGQDQRAFLTRLFRLGALQARDELVEITFPMLQRINKETEQRQGLGNLLEILGNGHVVRRGKCFDSRNTGFEVVDRRKMAKHGQGAGNLS